MQFDSYSCRVQEGYGRACGSTMHTLSYTYAMLLLFEVQNSTPSTSKLECFNGKSRNSRSPKSALLVSKVQSLKSTNFYFQMPSNARAERSEGDELMLRGAGYSEHTMWCHQGQRSCSRALPLSPEHKSCSQALPLSPGSEVMFTGSPSRVLHTMTARTPAAWHWATRR